jgi:hypothetical protein
MDEKRFLLGQALEVKVICHRDRKNPQYTQDQHCELVTVLDCIAADGRVIPCMYIYTGSRHLLGWHTGIPDKEQATLAWSNKG